MRYFSILTRVLMVSMILSACGTRAEATPTVNPANIQGTMVAAAFTMVAQTQAAIPTATQPLPTIMPTDTPAPTAMILPLPGSEGAATPVPNDNSGGGDPCIYKTLPALLNGETIKIRIDNTTKVTLSFSIYLNQTTPNSQCGYRGYTLTPGQSLIVNDLVEGCYTLWAWNPDPQNYFIVTNGTNCLDNSAPWVFDISTGDIRLR